MGRTRLKGFFGENSDNRNSLKGLTNGHRRTEGICDMRSKSNALLQARRPQWLHNNASRTKRPMFGCSASFGRVRINNISISMPRFPEPLLGSALR